jgi:hypothetical protein
MATADFFSAAAKIQVGESGGVVLREPERSVLEYVSTGSAEEPHQMAANVNFNARQ